MTVVGVALQIRWAVLILALVVGAVGGYGYDGVVGAALWLLAGIGCVHVGNFCADLWRLRVVGEVVDTALEVPPEVDAALRGLAHDLRSPIAAAAAAFAAVDDHVDGMADDDVGYFCGVVRQNLREATARLKTLEEYRLQPPAEEQGPALRQARHVISGRRR